MPGGRGGGCMPGIGGCGCIPATDVEVATCEEPVFIVDEAEVPGAELAGGGPDGGGGLTGSGGIPGMVNRSNIRQNFNTITEVTSTSK